LLICNLSFVSEVKYFLFKAESNLFGLLSLLY
jgi:hypothetical protein